MKTPPSIPDRPEPNAGAQPPPRKRSRFPLRALLVLALLALAAGSTAFLLRSPIRAKWSAWHAQSHFRRAEQFAKAGNWPQAFQTALVGNKLDPAALKGVRILFEAGIKTNSPFTINAATSLFLNPGANFDEKLKALSFCDISHNDKYFFALFARLEEAQRQHPDAQFLMIRFLLPRGGKSQASKMMEAYFASGGTDRRFQGLKARMLLYGNPAEQEQGQKLVAALLQPPDEVAQEAFNLLWDVPPASLRLALFPANLKEGVAKLPKPGTRENLILAQFELAKALQDAAQQATIFQAAAAQFGTSDPETLCNWLTRFQHFDLILNIVDEEKGRSSLSLFDHRLRALTAVKGVEAAEAWLANPLPDASPLDIWLSRAKLARLRKDRPLEQKCWKEALSVAAVDDTYRQYLPIFRAAMALREREIACRALLESAPHANATFPASLEIQPIIDYLYSQDRLQDLNVVCQRVLSDEPSNALLQNNVIYISLILGHPLAKSTELARQLLEKHPKILGIRTTLALALRMDKRSQDALPILESPDADWRVASPADLTIRSLILDDCGQSARAIEIRNQVNSKKLTSAERRAFAAVLKEPIPVMDPDQLYSEIRSWMIQGGQKHARQLLEEYFANGGIQRRFFALYAEVLLELNYAENDPLRGQEIVAKLLEQADEPARKAFSLLASFPADLMRPDAFPPNLQTWVGNLPNPTSAEQIAAAKLDSLHSPNPADRDRILVSLISSLGKTEPEQLATLFVDLERYDLTLKLLDESASKTSPRLRDFRLQALMKVQGADAARKWLEASQSTAETPQAWLTTARLRHGTGDAAGTLNAFREASALAEHDPATNHFLEIYQTAVDLGQTSIATRALLNASLHPKSSIPSSSNLAPTLARLYAADRLGDLHTLTRTLLSQDPSNDTLRNQQAYLSLILKDPTSRALDITADLVKSHPNILGFRTTRALALTLNENFEEALAILPREEEFWSHASPVDIAILALALDNTGNPEAAAAARSRYEPNELTATERRAFAAAKRKLPEPLPAASQPPGSPATGN